MMVTIGPYILIGVVAIFALGVMTLIALMMIDSDKRKKALQAAKETPREDTVAEQIQKQFQQDDKNKERYIHTQSGVSKTSVKRTRSAFVFQNKDADTELTLDSDFENDTENPLT